LSMTGTTYKGTYKGTYKDTGRYLGMQQDRNIYSTDIRAHISICKGTYKHM